MNFTSIIVDDEEQSIATLQEILNTFFPHVSVIGVANNVQDAIQLLKKQKPDILFLDVNMPPFSGFDVLNEVDCQDLNLIFCTAYDHYAIQAIRYSAFDYLLKPISVPDLMSALSRLAKAESAQIQTLLHNQTQTSPSKYVVNTHKEQYILDVADIQYLKADQCYTAIHTQKNGVILSSKNLAHHDSLLDEKEFVRVHKSYTVNLKHVMKYDKKESTVKMSNGESIIVSIRKRGMMENLMSLKNGS